MRALAKAGARVVIAARNLIRANEVADDIRKTTGNNQVEVEKLDLASLKSVGLFVNRYLAKNRPLHILINNAASLRSTQLFTEDGFDMQFGTNHIGHFALTIGLLPALKAAKGARVVMLSSITHAFADIDFDDPNFKQKKFDKVLSYAQSKTANILFAVALTQRYSVDGIYANAVMPGGILTPIFKDYTKDELQAIGWYDENGNPSKYVKTVEQGAATSVWAAIAPELEGRGGLYLEDCQIMPEITLKKINEALIEYQMTRNFKDGYPQGYLARAVDPVTADRLWKFTQKLIAEATKEN